MTSTIKVNNVQNQCGANIINENSNTITIGASGDTIALASGASQTGFGREGSVNWQTSIKTGDFTAVNGEGYFVNTTSGAIIVTLPASPSSGSIVAIKDYANTFDTNKVTLNRNGSNIEGLANNFTIETEGQAVTLVYADATKGWLPVEQAKSGDLDPPPLFTVATGGTITTTGDFKVHTFTGPGTFTVTQLGNAPTNPGGGPTNVDYRVVAGGGNGGTSYYSGGGGAGGHRTTFPSPSCNAGAFPVAAQAYPITVGAGGAGASTPAPGTPDTGTAADITPGSNSIFSTIISAGGGGGTPLNVQDPADAGGSGGGAGAYNISGGAGNTPPVSPPQGNPGGNGSLSPGGGGGGGGGGAGGAGANGTGHPGATGGNGGAGTANSITGSPVTLAGGGGGGQFCGPTSPAPAQGSGGSGGGGDGNPGASPGGNGTANTGGGGGAIGGRTPGSAPYTGGSGGSGTVIIRYKFQ